MVEEIFMFENVDDIRTTEGCRSMGILRELSEKFVDTYS